MMLALTHGACERSTDASSSSSAPKAATSPEPSAPPPSGREADAAPPRDSAPPGEPLRRALGKGDRLPPLAALDPAGAPQCSHCASKGPTMLVFATATTLVEGESWRDLDAIGRFYADDGLTALAIVAGHRDGTLVAGNAADAQTVDATRARRRIAMPVLAAAATGTADARALADAPLLADDPTVVLLDASGAVAWTGTRDASWQALDRAIVGLVAPAAVATP